MTCTVSLHEVEFSDVRAQGPGGQNVNKVSSAVHLRFDIGRSSLPPAVKHRLLALPDQRVTREGVIVIKAQTSRSRTHNRAEALARLQALIDEAARVRPVRRATRPTLASKVRRLEGKALRSRIKASRGRGGDVD
ncbi:MAG: alternative ribosome rescue aminoacyl-tRNA hydrolase ArfB [Burkholderiaceae bacterium]